MAKLRDLPLEPLVRGWLRDEKLRTSDDLWREVGPDFQAGLTEVNRKTRIARDRLVEALGAAAAAERRWRLSWGEALLGLACVALLALAGLRVAEAFGVQPFPLSGLTAEVDQMVVAPRGGLPAFHVLAENDLRPAPRPLTAAGMTHKADALGRYLLRPVAAAGVVRESDLSSIRLPAAILAGRWIVTLHVDLSALGPQVAPGTTALLALSPKPGTARPAVEAEALILDIAKGASGGPPVVTVAIAPERRAEIAAALGSAEVFLGRVIPDPGTPKMP